MTKDAEPLEETETTEELSPVKETGEYPAVAEDRALLVVLVGNARSRTHVVADEAIIGRTPEASICIGCDDVSRRHARVRRISPGEWQIEDLDSKNGTFVNGLPVQQQLLCYGDKVKIGATTVLVFCQYDRLDDQLMQAQRLESIGQITSGVAHDFNNLLGALTANVGYLREVSPDTTIGHEEIRGCLEDMALATRRAADLTRQLLGLARRGRDERKVNLSKVLNDVSHLISRTFPPSIQIARAIDEDLTVSGDPSQLHQVVVNLCINARDAMPDGGTLNLAAREMQLSLQDAQGLGLSQPGSYVELIVSDTGSGMEEEVQRRAFEPFFTTKEKGEGTGLGLATVASIIQNHGGRIHLHSAIGAGTRFGVYLPAHQAPSRVIAPHPRASATRRLVTWVTLLVDSEEVFLNSTHRLLGGLGHPAHPARNGAEAIRIFEEQHAQIRLILLDMTLPDMTGAEAFYALRKIDPSASVVLCSAQLETRGVHDLLADGAKAFLQKPYDVETLRQTLLHAC